MAFKSILLLSIFLVVATNVFSYDEDLKIVVNHENPSIVSVAAAKSSPKKTPPKQPPPAKVPPSPAKTPPTQSPPPSKAPPSPTIAPPNQSPPPAIAPTPPPTQPPVPPPTQPPTPIVKSWKDCIPLCIYRCTFHFMKKSCLSSCMICCDRCKCVPPGFYGNRNKCGKCYTDMFIYRDKLLTCP
ncbi:gibberellin-regulated protein [Trifolium repens]|nr:gibberellin-regulated protein [Trifolium repens]